MPNIRLQTISKDKVSGNQPVWEKGIREKDISWRGNRSVLKVGDLFRYKEE